MATSEREPTGAHDKRWTRAVAAGVAACAIAAVATYALARQPQPLGMPVPVPPQPFFKVTDATAEEASYRKRIMNAGWLLRMAPQPDGVPYLYNEYESLNFQFKVRYPYGAENIQFPYEEFLKDNVESQATFKIDQPLAAVKVTLLPKERKQKQVEFLAALIAKLKQDGVKVLSDAAEIDLPGGTFVTCSYLREREEDSFVHRLYVANVQTRALVFDFSLRTDSVADGEKYARKIMNSFDPGKGLGALLEQPAAQLKQEEPGKNEAAPRQQPAEVDPN